ncbi:MAG TPA: hypothetical protein VK021_12410 [Flavobacteriaceae bacterium]|nr:hypothetical protein [Flavobacteriaceae bacterium]
MKTYLKYFIVVLFSVGVFTACTERDETFTVSKGNADFSNYVAFGNSLTAGYADNALYYDAQVVSFPNLMAEQLEEVGGGDFSQPLVDPGSVGIGSDGNARLILGVVDGELSPVPAAPQGDMSIFTTSVAGEGPFNNMGVPGATVTTAVFPGYGNPANGEGNFNPFFTRMTTDPANASMLSDAVAQQPSFFTVFIGNNDVLGYATTGGASTPITPMEGGPGVGFSASYDAVIEGFLATGAKGAIANIPDVTSTPFFTTVPYNGLVLEDQGQVDALNDAYAPLIDMGLVAPFELGPNGFIIEDENIPQVGMRQIQEGELILLSVPQDQLAAGLGSQTPIPDQYVLTADELSEIKTATENFNQKIKSVAQANDLAFVDVNSFLSKLDEQGLIINGREITTEFVTGGAFSLDGVHLTPIGNVLLANQFIKAINSTYDAKIPQVDPTVYGGVVFP